MQVITVLEGEVEKEMWDALQNAFNKFKDKDTSRPSQSFLVQDTGKPKLWRIISIWKSMDALQKMKGKGTPAGVLMFREAGVEPSLSILETKALLTP